MRLKMLNTVDFWVALAFLFALFIIGKYAGAPLKKVIDDYIVQENKKHQETEELLELSRNAHQEAQDKLNYLEKDFVRLHEQLEKEKKQIEESSHEKENHIKELFEKLLEDRKENLVRHAHLITQEQAASIIKESLEVYFANNWDKDRNNQLIISQLSD